MPRVNRACDGLPQEILLPFGLDRYINEKEQVMAIWKPASTIFHGGTDQIKALQGRKVRARAPIHGILVYDPVHGKQESFDLHLGAVGLVANPHPTRNEILVAFPVNRGQAPTTLDQLARSGSMKVLVINEPTFKWQFDIQSP